MTTHRWAKLFGVASKQELDELKYKNQQQDKQLQQQDKQLQQQDKQLQQSNKEISHLQERVTQFDQDTRIATNVNNATGIGLGVVAAGAVGLFVSRRMSAQQGIIVVGSASAARPVLNEYWTEVLKSRSQD